MAPTSSTAAPDTNDANIEMGRMARKKKYGDAPEDTDYQPVNWRKLLLSPKYIPWHILSIVILMFIIFIAIKHDAVVAKLRPLSEKLRDIPAGWLIPIVILFIISFPPLFGHEIVALLCGVVWGLWIGFAIVAAGTFFGEIGTWFAFKYALRQRAAKLERTNLNYGALARMTREGRFWIVLLIRLSAFPAHFSTAVFATCNVNFWYFFIATFLSLPKQVFLVYLGVLLVQKQSSNGPKDLMFGAVFVLSVGLGIWMWFKMKKVKKVLLEEQAARREKRLREEMEQQDKEVAGRRVMMEVDSATGPSAAPTYSAVPQGQPGQQGQAVELPAGQGSDVRLPIYEEHRRQQTWPEPSAEFPSGEHWRADGPPGRAI